MIPRRLSLVEVTGDEPLELAEAKRHLRVDLDDDDTQIAGLITAAREYFEDETERQLVTATYELVLDRFPSSPHSPIELPRPPLQSVTSIVYLDPDGVETTWPDSEYTAQAYGGPLARPGRVYPTPSYVWPSTQDVPGAVTVTFVAGYTLVPASMKAVVKALLSDFYHLRESQVTGTIVSENKTMQRLMQRYRQQAVA